MMKRTILLLGLCCVFALGVKAQVSTLVPGSEATPYTVAALPSGFTGRMAYVTDAASATDCTVGGGAVKVLCVYNGTAWVYSAAGSVFTGGAVTTPITGPNGTAGAPTFAFTSDADGTGTGIFRSAANTISFATNGVERWVINGSGALNPSTDNTNDIGNGTVNPRDIQASRKLITGKAGTNTGDLDLLGLTSGTVSIKPQAAAGTYNFNLPTSAGTAGQALLSGGGGGAPMTWGSAGITNSAAANVLPKSNGTNLVASRISDDGTTILLNGNTSGGVEIDSFTASISVGATAATIQLAASVLDGSNALSVDFGSNSFHGTKFALDDTAKTAVLRAETSISIDSGAGSTTIGDVNGAGNGTKITVDDASQNLTVIGTIVVHGNVQPDVVNGFDLGGSSLPWNNLYIGNAATNNIQLTGTATGARVATLPDATGTIALVGTNLGTVLSILSANATLASATGTTYSSPGYGGTPLASTNEGQVGWVCPRAGTIAKLYVITGSVAKVNTPATTITIRKNGVDTAVTILLTQTTATTTSDLTHSFSVAAGDVITASFTTTGAAAVSTSIAGVSFLLN